MNTEFENLTVEDLMGQDYYVWISHNKTGGIDIYFEDEDGKETIYEKTHPYAVESFYTLCKNFIYRYERLLKNKTNINPSELAIHLQKKAG